MPAMTTPPVAMPLVTMAPSYRVPSGVLPCCLFTVYLPVLKSTIVLRSSPCSAAADGGRSVGRTHSRKSGTGMPPLSPKSFDLRRAPCALYGVGNIDPSPPQVTPPTFRQLSLFCMCGTWGILGLFCMCVGFNISTLYPVVSSIFWWFQLPAMKEMTLYSAIAP